MRFTVLIPTHANGVMIATALDSVLEQIIQEFEIFVVLDGAALETHQIVDAYVARDARVRAFKFEKGERHGEAWRHKALAEARSDAICYLCDDDFWFPDHLQAICGLLAEADFAHTRQTSISTDFLVSGRVGDLSDPQMRARMLQSKFNFFGPTVAAHRLDAYRRLPEGWAPAPDDIWTDLNMWRKWIAAEGFRLRSSERVTSLHFPRHERMDRPHAHWGAETAYWRQAFLFPQMQEALNELLPPSETEIPVAAIAARASNLRTQAEAAQHRVHAASLAEAEAQRAARQALLDSTIWRATKPLRQAIAALRGGKPPG